MTPLVLPISLFLHQAPDIYCVPSRVALSESSSSSQTAPNRQVIEIAALTQGVSLAFLLIQLNGPVSDEKATEDQAWTNR